MGETQKRYGAQEICSCCVNGNISILADGKTAMVQCKLMKLDSLDYEKGTCPHRVVKHYEQTFVDVMRLAYAKNYRGIRPNEVKKWERDPDDCPCICCIRVRFFLDNLEQLGQISTKKEG